MELPQSRPFGTEGRKATHDFLSLYTHSTVHQQDPRPPPSQGNFLKTHDFLEPLERGGKGSVEKEGNGGVEHILPGGIGTYTISHLPYLTQTAKPHQGSMFPILQGGSSSVDKNNEENSNCSSYTGSGFSLWEEQPAFKKGKTGKENAATKPDTSTSRSEPPAAKLGQWTPERPCMSSSNNYHHNSLSSLSSSQPSAQKSQSFIEMMKSAKSSTSDKDTDDGEDFAPKKESPTMVTPIKGELRVKVDGKNHEQKPNTPRSKHSATEQRRRSKINDRFQKLRELIPHSDQKRDKASFLFEVIEYIQYLQEKVQKFEGSYPGWNHEAAMKMMPWRNNQRPAENFGEQPRSMVCGSSPALIFATNLDEKNVSVPSIVPGGANPLESSTFKSVDHQSGLTNKAVPFPMSLHPHIITPVANAQLPPRLPSDATDDTLSQPHAQTRSPIIESSASDAGHKLKPQELAIEGGTINISSVYSQGLLNTLTKALQSSGVDLTQASISVQIQLGKRANGRMGTPTSVIKDNEILSGNQGKVHLRDVGCEESDQILKKLKTGRN